MNDIIETAQSHLDTDNANRVHIVTRRKTFDVIECSPLPSGWIIVVTREEPDASHWLNPAFIEGVTLSSL